MPTERQTGRIKRNRNGGPRRKVHPQKYDKQWSEASGPKDWVPAPGYDSLSDAPPDLVMRAATEKLPWVQKFVLEGCPYGKLLPYAVASAELRNLPLEAVPPYKTLNTWAHQYMGYGILGLVDKVRKTAGDERVLDGEAKHLVEVGLVGGKQGYSNLTSFVNRHTPSHEKPIKYHSIYRYAKKFKRENAALMAMATAGEVAVRNRFRLALSHGILPGGVEWAVDSTVANNWARIPDLTEPGGWKPVRPVFTLIEDIGSRVVLTFNFSLVAIDSGIILGTFQRAVDPAFNHPGLFSFPPPHRVSVDPGAEHRGVFSQAMKRMGIDLKVGRSNEPQGRARLERAIESVETEVFAHQVGYSATQKRFDPYAPPEADTKRNLTQLKYDPYRLEVPIMALPRIPDLEAAVLGWATVYNDRSHRGLPLDSAELRRLIALTDHYDTLEVA